MIIVNMYFNSICKNYKWYRKWIGGTWYYVVLQRYPEVGGWWTTKYPTKPDEIVNKTENY